MKEEETVEQNEDKVHIQGYTNHSQKTKTMIMKNLEEINLSESVPKEGLNRSDSVLKDRINHPDSALEDRIDRPDSVLEDRIAHPDSALEDRIDRPDSALEDRIDRPDSVLEDRIKHPDSALEDGKGGLISSLETPLSRPDSALDLELPNAQRRISVDGQESNSTVSSEIKDKIGSQTSETQSSSMGSFGSMEPESGVWIKNDGSPYLAPPSRQSVMDSLSKFGIPGIRLVLTNYLIFFILNKSVKNKAHIVNIQPFLANVLFES